MTAMRACRRHPKQQAGWTCASCHADLCPDCVAKQVAGPKGRPLAVCCACGRAVLPITLHRRQVEPFMRRMWGAFGFPLGTAGILSLCFVGFVRALTSYAGAGMAGGGAFALRQGLYWAFVFFIIRGVANGERRMGVFDFRDMHADIIAPSFKGILSTAILWIPAAVYIYLAADDGLTGLLTYPSYRDPAVWLLGLLGALYAPMALLAGATDLGFGHILNPVFICVAIVRTGKDYLVAVVAITVVLLLGLGGTAVLSAILQHLPVPFVGRWLAMTVGLYAPFVAAGILGNLLYLHGEVLDWGRGEEYQVPLLPGAEPRGQYHPKPKATREESPAGPLPPPLAPPPALAPGPVQSAEPSLRDLDLSSGLVSLLNLSSLPSVVEPPPAPSAPDLPPLLDAGVVVPLASLTADAAAESPPPSVRPAEIRLPSAILEAQAFYEPDAAAPVDLPPATPPAPATVLEQQSPALPGAAAPTMLGFSPALPNAEGTATRIGHQAVRPEAPPTATKKG